MGVWVGFDEPYPIPPSDKYVPMTVWGKVMKEVIETLPHISPADATFRQPEGIVTLTVDSKSGLLPSELSKESGHLITDIFNRRFVPTKTDDSHQKARVVTYKGERYLAKEGTPDDFVTEGIFYRSPSPLPSREEILAINSKVAVHPPDWEQRLPEAEDPRTEVPGPPSAPRNVTANRTEAGISLSWQSDKEEDLLGYRIYRADALNGFARIGTVKDPEVLSYTDAKPPKGDAAYYVTAVDITGRESAPSAVASVGTATTWQIPGSHPFDELPGNNLPSPSAGSGGSPDRTDGQQPSGSPPGFPPSAPKSLEISSHAGGWKLKWEANDPSEEVIAYNIYFNPDGNSGFLLIDTITGTGYIHLGGLPTSSYVVTAVNRYGESAFSNIVTAPQP